MNSKEMTETELKELKQAMELTIEQTMVQRMEPIIAPIMAELQKVRAELQQLKEQPATPTKTIISLYAASQLIGKAVATIRTLAQAGKLPSHKVGKHRIYYKEELIEWMHGKCEQTEGRKEIPAATPKRSDGPLSAKDRLAPTLAQRGRRAKPVHI